jgi:hypothetical protein
MRFFDTFLTCFDFDNFITIFMKKLFTIILLLGITGSIVPAQTSQTVVVAQPGQTVTVVQPAQRPASSGPSVRLHGYATYAFDDNQVDSYYSTTDYFSGSIKGGFQYGGGLEVMPAPQIGLEFTYYRLDSKAPMEYYNNGVQNANLDLAQNFLFLSFNKYMPVNPKIEPFAGMQLGMDIFNVTNPDKVGGGSDGATKFAWGARVGTNIWASEKVGIKLQVSLISAVQAIGGGVYFGTGGGGAGVTGFSTYYQFNLGGGLVFKLK